MIITMNGLAGQTLNLDLREKLGESVEIQCFHFVIPPIEFQLTRNRFPLQEWQPGNTEMYDLQHGPGMKDWCRNGHCFWNDLDHRTDVATCGVLSKGLVIETTGLNFHVRLLVWPRETTIRARPASSDSMRIIQPGPSV